MGRLTVRSMPTDRQGEAQVPCRQSKETAVVTGSNKGIGFHIAAALAQSNQYGTVVLACRNPALGEEAAAELDRQSSCAVVFVQLDLNDDASISSFVTELHKRYGTITCFVNNAATAYKAADPTPFDQQTGPTLHINLLQTLKLTENVLSMLLSSQHGRLVNIASMAGKLRQVSPELQARFRDESLTLDGLRELAGEFTEAVAQGNHEAHGWSKSNYGFSKLCLIAATKVLSREHPSLRINCCCPGYCDTDMSSHKGPRSAVDGAMNAVPLCLQLSDDGPTGEFFQDFKLSSW